MSTWNFSTYQMIWLRDQQTYPDWQQPPRITERIAIGSPTGRAEYSSVGAAPATITGSIFVTAAAAAALKTAYRTAAETTFTHGSANYPTIITALKLDPLAPAGDLAGYTGTITLSRLETA